MKKDNINNTSDSANKPQPSPQSKDAHKEVVRKLRKYKKIIEHDEYDDYYR